ncbi:ribonuclease D [Roseibacillus persicicus]|uniref:Ribonuclease D n=1 Tax=Roseibacillus persicicus TaxID=454148 RepID=A0A918TDP1_9BACT|nr:ribonuclease D [Roseibacillus persicicus]GHC44733.1 ribonuclease D [Roseibacillus persicicus]
MSEELGVEPVVWGYDEELLQAELLGLDLEADSLFRFSEKICLVQITDGKRGVLVDPLEQDLSELAQRLLSRPLWMHGADYDMALMRRDWGGVPVKVWDTQIGARLLGCRKFGYANLVEEFFGVVLSKGSQKADWGKRPLPDKMAQYALNDVKYLIPMARKIEAGLRELGRFEWFEESCDWDRERALERSDNKDNAWRIKGSGKFDRKTLAFLKAVWTWRESEAAKWDRPSFMVAGNKDLLAWSIAAANGERLDLNRSMRPDRRRRLLEGVEAARSLKPDEWPEKVRAPRRERDREREKLVDAFLAKREKKGEELGIEPSVLGSRASFEAFASGDSSKLMRWQKSVMELA